MTFELVSLLPFQVFFFPNWWQSSLALYFYADSLLNAIQAFSANVYLNILFSIAYNQICFSSILSKTISIHSKKDTCVVEIHWL